MYSMIEAKHTDDGSPWARTVQRFIVPGTGAQAANRLKEILNQGQSVTEETGTNFGAAEMLIDSLEPVWGPVLAGDGGAFTVDGETVRTVQDRELRRKGFERTGLKGRRRRASGFSDATEPCITPRRIARLPTFRRTSSNC